MAAQTPYLTIIMPTFRAAKTLRASLDSVLCQRFTDWQLLIMDGGSTDGTLELAHAAAQADPRIRIFSQPDKGVYDAMNKGIGEAAGEWLYFLGSDDLLQDEQVLDAVFATADHRGYDLLYGNVVGASYKGVYDGVFTYEKLLSRNVSHQAMFFRRALFGRLGEYDLRYKAYADWEFNLRCFSDERVRIRFIDRTIASFGADGLSSRHDVPFLREVLLPARVRWLEQQGGRPLRRITLYDEYWRLLRNAAIRDGAVLRELAGPAIPPAIVGMAGWQHRIPTGLLKIGFCSKMCMFAGYLSHLLTGKI
jgi:glycosyltransferase involved in cell wall biosynthesis